MSLVKSSCFSFRLKLKKYDLLVVMLFKSSTSHFIQDREWVKKSGNLSLRYVKGEDFIDNLQSLVLRDYTFYVYS